MEPRSTGHRGIERDAAVRADEVGRVGQPSVGLVQRPLEVIHDNRPRDLLAALVALGAGHLLLMAYISWLSRSWMGLADDYVDEVDAVAPKVVEALERLDRADGHRSGERSEVEDRGPVAKRRQREHAAADSRQLEVGCGSAGTHAAKAHRCGDLVDQMVPTEPGVVVSRGVGGAHGRVLPVAASGHAADSLRSRTVHPACISSDARSCWISATHLAGCVSGSSCSACVHSERLT